MDLKRERCRKPNDRSRICSDTMSKIIGSNSSLQKRIVRRVVPPLYKLFPRIIFIRCGTKSKYCKLAPQNFWYLQINPFFNFQSWPEKFKIDKSSPKIITMKWFITLTNQQYLEMKWIQLNEAYNSNFSKMNWCLLSWLHFFSWSFWQLIHIGR